MNTSNIEYRRKLEDNIEKFVYTWGICLERHIRARFGEEGVKALRRMARDYKLRVIEDEISPPYYDNALSEKQRTLIFLDELLQGSLKGKVKYCEPAEYPFIATIATFKNRVLPVAVILDGEEDILIPLIKKVQGDEPLFVIYQNSVLQNRCQKLWGNVKRFESCYEEVTTA